MYIADDNHTLHNDERSGVSKNIENDKLIFGIGNFDNNCFELKKKQL